MDGQQLFVNISTFTVETAKKIKEGDVITVKYDGTNVYNKLIKPEFLRKRTDMKWNELIKQKIKDNNK